MVEAEETTEIQTEDNQTATLNPLSTTETKDNNNEQHVTPIAQTVEEIVGHILMQNQEFQRLLEKQRTNSTVNVRQQRFNKRVSADTSDESDSENANYVTNSSNHGNNNRLGRTRATHREQRLIKTNNAWNSLSSAPARDNQQPLHLFYDNLKTTHKSTETIARSNHVQEKRALFEAFKRQNIVTESKVIKTALRIRENSTSITSNEEISPSSTICESIEKKEINTNVITERIEKNDSEQDERCNDESNDANDAKDTESKGFGNYDNLQHVWEGLQTERDVNGNDSPTRPAVWLTKLCEGLPTSPPKCGSLPRSFQISPNSQPTCVTKSRFLQRDGKPMSERPFTIASDKPAEINLEDMERYASTCQPEGRIAKFPMPATSTSSSSSTFFCSLEDTRLTDADAYSDMRMSASGSTNIHPDHKIYRANGGGGSGSTIFRNVFKAGSRLQGRLRNTMSTETLECNDELERTRYFRSLGAGGKYAKRRTKQTKQHSREPSSDVEELMGCSSISDQRIPQLYYKQGSSSLGARIAQSDYADPTILFAENKRAQSSSIENQSKPDELADGDHEEQEKEVTNNKDIESRESETDSFYEKSFEIIENYADADIDEAFRDSAIFSDVEEIFMMQQPTAMTTTAMTKIKIAPPIPIKKKQETSLVSLTKCKPNIAQKPDYLKIKPKDWSKMVKEHIANDSDGKIVTKFASVTNVAHSPNNCSWNVETDCDVSAGQSQAGWVRKIVGQLQGHVET